MTWLGERDKTIFLGQAVEVPGVFMHNTLKYVPISKKREMPVCESLQMQMTLGLAFGGMVPVSIFPRWNFLLLATSDLVNMIDKVKDISCGELKPKMIIRTAVGPDEPVHPGHQHVGDFTDAFRLMLKNTEIVRLDETEMIFDEYVKAYERDDGINTVLVEIGNRYND